MNAYSTNRRWSDRFLPEIKNLVGQHLLSAAPDPFDHFEATDLMMLNATDLRIAARVRRPGYAQRYPYQFTLRSHVPSGAQTELAKVVNGHGDWMFYGHADASETGVQSWWLLDLRAFRAALIRSSRNGHSISTGVQANPDGTRFRWFDIRSFPEEPPLVVASSGPAKAGNPLSTTRMEV